MPNARVSRKCATPESPWSAQPQSVPGVPSPRVFLQCPTPEFLSGVPNPRVCLECPNSQSRAQPQSVCLECPTPNPRMSPSAPVQSLLNCPNPQSLPGPAPESFWSTQTHSLLPNLRVSPECPAPECPWSRVSLPREGGVFEVN